MPSKKGPTVVRETAILEYMPASTFKATCLELMDDLAARHGEIVITKHGRPVVKVGPIDQMPPSPIGFLRGVFAAEADVVAPDFAAWEMSDTDPLGGAAW